MRALKIAATGMDAQQTRVEVISNNLANMSTTAYMPRRAEFVDLMYQQPRMAGAVSAADGSMLPAGVQLGLGTRVSTVAFDPIQGPMKATSGDLDLAIDGQGWFEITLPNGDPAFTRDGTFKRTGEGRLVNSEGYPLVPDIVVPEDTKKISINTAGEVYAHFDDVTEPELLGAITIALFANPKGLEPLGSNLYKETPASGPPVMGDPTDGGRGRLLQGYVEESAVDPVREITELISAQRGYELNSKVITAADQMLATTTQIR
jgi:flagellar basal-body rod protein FlgG